MARTSVERIVSQAKHHAAAAGGQEEYVFAALGTVPADLPLAVRFSVGERVAFDTRDLSRRGRKIFDKFKGALKKAVCDDFMYCTKRDKVDAALTRYLPEIVTWIIKRIPISGKLPGWLAKVLTFFGIPATSLGGVVVFLVSWLIIKGCNALCDCKA